MMPRPKPPQSDESEKVVVDYFIDEAGDPVLFGKRKVIVGTQSSRYFILGKLEIDDPAGVGEALQTLRNQLLADPYFNSAPSMQPEDGKTAVVFHAKDDLPEVRDRVFHLLAEHDLHFSAVIRDKMWLVEQVQARNVAEPKYRYNENEIYDELVSHASRPVSTRRTTSSWSSQAGGRRIAPWPCNRRCTKQNRSMSRISASNRSTR